MKKQLISILLSLCMLVAMMPVTALGETNTLLVGDDQTYAWTEDGLKQAMEDAKTGNTVRLMGGAGGTLSFAKVIYLNYAITLDLNGQNMEYTGSSNVGIVVNDTLTVLDSSTDETGSYTTTGTGQAFYVNSGLIISGGTVGAIRVNDGDLTVSGGKVIAKSSAISSTSSTVTISITGGEVISTEGSALNIMPTGGKPEDMMNISITDGILSAPGTYAGSAVIYSNTNSSKGATNITIGGNARVTATEANGFALMTYSQRGLTLTIGSDATIKGGYGPIARPSVSSTSVSKEAIKQKAVNFTLNYPENYKNPTWKLYASLFGTMEVSGVSAASSGSALTITSSGEDLAERYYYLTVAADPTQYYAESDRIELKVVAPAMTGMATISGTPQVGQTLTLTNEISGGSTPVWYATDNSTATGGTVFAGGILTAAEVGKYIYVTVLADADHSGSVNSNVLGPVDRKADGPDAPRTTFSFDGANANKLIGATDLMEYSLNGGISWTDCTADMELNAASITVTGIQVRVKETRTHEAGAEQTITITKAATPAAGKTDVTVLGDDGTLTGVSNLMEYKRRTETTYTAISGSTVTGLPAGTYHVRVKATGTVLASDNQELVIAVFVKSTPTTLDLTYYLTAVNYDGSAKSLSMTVASGKDLGEITVKYNGSTTAPINAGIYPITVDIAGNTEYNATELSLGNYIINKINYTGATTVPVSVLEEGQVGATVPLPTLPEGASYGITVTGGAITMTDMSIAGTTLTYTAAASTAGQTGTMTIPVTGAINYNDYSIVVTVTSTAKTPQAISYADSNVTKTYGDTSFINALTLTTINGTITYASDDTSVATVDPATGEVTIITVGDGSATITATAAETGTHAQATASYTVTVAKKALTLKADDKSMTKGNGLPTFTYTATGLVGSDAVTTAPTMATITDGTAVGTFDITIADGVVTNATSYDITYTKGTLTVAELLFTATITDGTGGGSYGEGATVTITANDRNGYTFTGWSGSDVTFADAAAHTTTFIMPAKAVTITANYSQNSSGGTPSPSIPNPPAQGEDKAPGVVEKTGEQDDSAPAMNINNSSDELKERALTPQDQEMVAGGENAKIVLKVTDISTSVSDEEKKLIQDKLAAENGAVENGAVENGASDIPILYVDLSLYKQVGSREQTKVTETKGKISISIEVPEEFWNTDVTKNRAFYVIRIHDGAVTRIDGTYDPATHLFTFETDRFSTYALTYEDTSTIQTYHDFHHLQLKAKANKTSQILSYKKVTNVDGYLIYGGRCGEEMKKLAEVSAGTTSYTVKKLKQGTNYKYQVKAYRMIDKEQVIIMTSKVVHSITESKKYGNPTKVTTDTASITLAAGKSKTVTGQVVLPKDKKLKEHTAVIRYESSNKEIATANSKGKITAKAKGTCYVYAYAQNGVYKRIKVTVK